LKSLREATERAVAALERDDPESARIALADGALATADLELFDSNVLQNLPGARADFEAIRTLQAAGIDRAAAARDAIGRDIETLEACGRGLRAYRPGNAPEQPALDLQS
jgi:hypothetical protein